MTDINWNLLQTPNIGNAFMEGFQRAREAKRQTRAESALAAFAQNPQDGVALNALMAVDPQTGMKMRDYQRNEQFRSALSEYGAAGGVNGLTPRVAGQAVGGVYSTPPIHNPNNGQMPDGAAPQLSNGELAMTAKDKAFLRMWEADPVKAMEIDSKLRDQAVERLKVANDAYGFAIQNLANVTDEHSYQQVRNGFIQQVQPLGIDIAGQIPDRYPGPEGVRSLLMRAVSAKDQIAALDRQDRTEAYIDNIEEDNERADLNTHSLIEDRNARRGIMVRGQNLADTRGRRGQDIASADRRRGQNIASADRRYGDTTDQRQRETGGRRRGGAARAGQSAGPVATDGKGNKVQWNGKAWVPVR
jgi:hypothetical protein